ncbi:MAG: hypothetical protein HZA35_02860 [Parcubacteria group bacterium]|nr:hypothetical protein [Parcubacteria group bacterium]
MISKEELVQLVIELKAKRVLNEEEADQYLVLAQGDDIIGVAMNLSLLLDEKSVQVDTEILDVTSELVDTAKKIAEESKDDAVISEVNRLEDEFSGVLEQLQKDTKEMRDDYASLAPVFAEAEEIIREGAIEEQRQKIQGSGA